MPQGERRCGLGRAVDAFAALAVSTRFHPRDTALQSRTIVARAVCCLWERESLPYLDGILAAHGCGRVEACRQAKRSLRERKR